jgi:zinc protease
MMRLQLWFKILTVPCLVLLSWWGTPKLMMNFAGYATRVPAQGPIVLTGASYWVLDNGVKVYHLPVHSIPMLDVEILFEAGSIHDNNAPGLAFLTNALLKEGTTVHEATAFSEALENVGGQIAVQTQPDAASIHLRTLVSLEQRDKATDLLAEMLSQPAFRKTDLARLQNQLLVRLSQDTEQPGKIGKRMLLQSVFGSHSYGSWLYGTPESIKAISVKDLQDFYHQFYNTHTMTIAIVGDITKSEANDLAVKFSRDISNRKFTSTGGVLGPEPISPKVEHIHFPSQQTFITLGALGVPIGHPDYAALAVGHHILAGSGMSSVLFETVRNQKGLTYDMRGNLMPFRWSGFLSFETHSRVAVSETALETIQELLKNFAEQGPTAEQLEIAKQNLKGGFPLKFMDNQTLSRSLAYLGFYGLPLDYNDRLLESFLQVTPESIQKAWSIHFSPEKYSIVVVGP